MHFNGDKFECMRFWPSRSRPEFDYVGPNGEAIEVKSDLKDLGVNLSSDLSFKLHIEKVVSSASKMAGWGLRTFKRRGIATMRTIWNSLVQPQLDYCSQFWSPSDQESINRIEAVQKHFLSRVHGMEVSSLSYWDKLKALRFYSQERRRERYMAIFLWKVSQGMVRGYDMEFTGVAGRRGRSALPRQIIASSSNLVKKARESSIGVKGVKIFNLLPAEVRNIDSDNVDLFKSELDSFLHSIPDQPTIAGCGRAAESNSLFYQIPVYMLNN